MVHLIYQCKDRLNLSNIHYAHNLKALLVLRWQYESVDSVK